MPNAWHHGNTWPQRNGPRRAVAFTPPLKGSLQITQGFSTQECVWLFPASTEVKEATLIRATRPKMEENVVKSPIIVNTTVIINSH